jgi:hypothetical protein
VHQSGPNRNCMQNFSSLSFRGEAVGVAQISVKGGGGGGYVYLVTFCAITNTKAHDASTKSEKNRFYGNPSAHISILEK